MASASSLLPATMACPACHSRRPDTRSRRRMRVADYLEAYAGRMELPIRTGVHVDSLDGADGGGFVVTAGADRFEARDVVVATGGYSEPRIPEFASELRPEIAQLHSSQYRSAAQLQPGGVLVVGASNSGGEIAHGAASGRARDLAFGPRHRPDAVRDRWPSGPIGRPRLLALHPPRRDRSHADRSQGRPDAQAARRTARACPAEGPGGRRR